MSVLYLRLGVPDLVPHVFFENVGGTCGEPESRVKCPMLPSL